MRRFGFISALAGLALGAWPLRAQSSGVVLLGADFQVNPTTSFRQDEAEVAIDADGGFVVVWQSEYSSGTDTDLTSIQGQRFDASGAPVGSEFQVNTSTTGAQHHADVAAGPDGDFVVVWLDGAPGPPTTIRGQRFDASGVPVTGELQLSKTESGYPSVAVQPGGGFVVVWEPYGGDEQVVGRRFAADGSPVGAEFVVNSITPIALRFPEVAADDAGDFVVVWQDYRDVDDRYDVRGRRFASSGAPIGADFRVNDDPSEEQYRPAVATASGAGFVVVWEHFSGGSYIRGRRFDSGGVPIGSDFEADQVDLVGLTRARVALDDNGDALVLWDEGFLDGDDLYARLHDASGSWLGEQFLVNSLTADHQNNASIALAATGQAVVVWTSDTSAGSDTSFQSIQGRRLLLPLFADGFESGDTSAWQ